MTVFTLFEGNLIVHHRTVGRELVCSVPVEKGEEFVIMLGKLLVRVTMLLGCKSFFNVP